MKTYKEKIAEIIISMVGKYSAYNIFRDWVEMIAIAIQNASCFFKNEAYQKREKQYIAIAQKYTEKEIELLGEAFAYLQLALEDNMEDALGDIFMKSGCGSKVLGQFFTPYHVSEFCGRLAIDPDYDGSYPLTMTEPSCGGGGMIIGTAATLKSKGINYQKVMRVVAQDLDWLGVYMTYVQLSLLGIDAIVVQGDTLCDPYRPGYPEERTLRTPKHMGVLI